MCPDWLQELSLDLQKVMNEPGMVTTWKGITSLAVGEGNIWKGLTTSHTVGEGTIRDYHLTLTVGEGNILKKELPPHALVGEGTIGEGIIV